MLAPQIFTHLTTPKMYFKSDVGRRAASCWALPHNSSLLSLKVAISAQAVLLVHYLCFYMYLCVFMWYSLTEQIQRMNDKNSRSFHLPVHLQMPLYAR